MPLIHENKFVPDHWQRLADDQPVPADGKIIIPLQRLDEARQVRGSALGSIGIHRANIARIDDVIPLLPNLPLISIAFPAFSDGRGFSLAKRLRRLGFKGTLRAHGPLIADQYPHALACGFDEIDISESHALRHREAHWRAATGSISLGYQRGYVRSGTILDRRAASRRA